MKPMACVLMLILGTNQAGTCSAIKVVASNCHAYILYMLALDHSWNVCVTYPGQLQQGYNTGFISQGSQLETAGQGYATDAGRVVRALQDALEASRLPAGVVLPGALPIQIHTAHFLLLLAELVHSGLTLLVPDHQHAGHNIHLCVQAVAVAVQARAEGLRGLECTPMRLEITDEVAASV